MVDLAALMSKKDPIELARAAAKALFDKKGFNVIALDLRGLSSLTEAIVVCEGSVNRHLVALGEEVKSQLKEFGARPIHVDGEGSGWVVLDYFDIMVHVMEPEMRVRYRLEQIWSHAKRIPLDDLAPAEQPSF